MKTRSIGTLLGLLFLVCEAFSAKAAMQLYTNCKVATELESSSETAKALCESTLAFYEQKREDELAALRLYCQDAPEMLEECTADKNTINLEYEKGLARLETLCRGMKDNLQSLASLCEKEDLAKAEVYNPDRDKIMFQINTLRTESGRGQFGKYVALNGDVPLLHRVKDYLIDDQNRKRYSLAAPIVKVDPKKRLLFLNESVFNSPQVVFNSSAPFDGVSVVCTQKGEPAKTTMDSDFGFKAGSTVAQLPENSTCAIMAYVVDLKGMVYETRKHVVSL